jgi:DNA polymerase III sliding clamp (beta) subunit (PCNA family)
MRVNKEMLLQTLEGVFPGVARVELLEQSSCFVFKDAKVMAFNEEIACVGASGLDRKYQGAVKAQKLLDILRLLPEDEADVEVTKDAFVIRGKGKRTVMALDKEIMLPIDVVETPEDWSELSEDFIDAAGMVQACAGKDETQFTLTCVHVHPDWVEGFDGYQLMRYELPTKVAEPFLARKDAVKHASEMGMTEICESESWVHFRNASGLQLSCRRYLEEYRDLTPILQAKGEPIVLPRGLGEAAQRAEVFSSENQDDNLVEVSLTPGLVMVTGRGASGRYEERKKISYDGPKMRFLISPELLGEITKKYNEASILPDKLMVDGGRWKYVTVLHSAEQAPEESD